MDRSKRLREDGELVRFEAWWNGAVSSPPSSDCGNVGWLEDLKTWFSGGVV